MAVLSDGETAAHLVQLHESLPQSVHLLTVDCVVLACRSQPRRRSHEQPLYLLFHAQFEPEAMLSRIADGWFPILAAC
jgi:hypothetical protein